MLLFLIGIPLFYFLAIKTSRILTDGATSEGYESEVTLFSSYYYNLLIALSCVCLLMFFLFLFLLNSLIKARNTSNITHLDHSFDDLKFQFSKGVTIENYEDGIRYIGLEKVKEWKSKFGYVFNIYGNDHFIDNKPHFHFDNKEKGVSCKMSFDGEIFESKGRNQIDKKALKELRYFLTMDNTQDIIVAKWNEKNPDLKYKRTI